MIFGEKDALTMTLQFERDESKAVINLEKHGIDFAEA